jgi:hypothetical protein
MTKTSFLNLTLLAILALLIQFNFFTNFQPNSKVTTLAIQSSSLNSSTSSEVLTSPSTYENLSFQSSSFSSQPQSSKVSSVSQSQNSSSNKISNSSSSSKSISTSSIQNPSSSSVASSSIHSSSKSSVITPLQNNNPMPIKITEVSFWEPDTNNTSLCGFAITQCGKFKWIELYNPNNVAINFSDYALVINNDRYKDADFGNIKIEPFSFGLVKSYRSNQTTSIIDGYPNLGSGGWVLAVDASNKIDVKITNKSYNVVDQFIVTDLSATAITNSGKIKTSYFRCSSIGQNQSYTLTEKKSSNQIPFTNTLGYEFYGTPGKDDDTCKVESPTTSGITTSVFTTPPTTPKSDLKGTPAVVDPVKAAVPEIVNIPAIEKVPELVKAVIKPADPVTIPEMVSFPALTTILSKPTGATIQITNKVTQKISTMVSKTEPLKIEFKDVVPNATVNTKKLAELYKQITPASVNENLKSKVLSPTNTFVSLSTVGSYNSSKQLQAKQILQPIQSSKPITPIINTKKVTLAENKYTSELTKIIEIDYQPAQAQWNFLSLVAIAYLFTNIYKKLKQVVSPLSNGLISQR